MPVGIYARVSTRAQAGADKTSIAEQVRLCRAWARDHSGRVVDIYKDAGVSGTLLERPELGRAITDAKKQLFDTLVVLDLNRLARDVYVQETIVHDLKACGVEVVSLNQPAAGDDPARDLVRQIFGAIAQYDRAMTVWRMKLGRDATRRARGHCEGAPRYGYAKSDGKITPNDDEQRAVALIRRRRREGRSLRAICSELEVSGIHPRRGQKWHPNTVRRVLAYGNKPFARAG